MRDTRFIFVEGIMGSGKSTTAWFIAEQLQQRHIAARFMLEGPTYEDPTHPLRVATDFAHPNAIWQDLTIDEFIEVSLRKWRAYVAEAQQTGVTTVCDGLLFHGNMTDLMLMNAEPQVLQNYVGQVLSILQNLKPIIIYFQHKDLVHALRAICEERGSDWETYQVNWKTGSPYGVQHRLQGFEGWVQLYKDYSKLCNDMLTQFTQPQLIIRNEGAWSEYYQEIMQFLA